MFKKVLTNKFVLYLVAFLALTNVLGFLMRNDMDSLIFFVSLGYLSSYFSKNMIVNFLIAILGTNVILANGAVREGFKEGNHEEEEDDDFPDEAGPGKPEGFKKKKKKRESLRNLKPQRLRRHQGSWDEEDDEDNGVARIDSAATMAATYKQMENVLGSGGMRNLAKDTKNLVDQQKGLMKSVEQMQPMMKQLGGMVSSFGGVDGINQMMKNLKGMGGLQKPPVSK